MKKEKALKILSISWPIVFAVFSVIWFANTPIICWDGIDKVTKQMTGGCYPDYTITATLFMLPCAFWIITEVILIIFYSRAKKKEQTSIK